MFSVVEQRRDVLEKSLNFLTKRLEKLWIGRWKFSSNAVEIKHELFTQLMAMLSRCKSGEGYRGVWGNLSYLFGEKYVIREEQYPKEDL